MLQIPSDRKVDVLVVGGGPTGLLTSYSLAREDLQVLNIEQYNKEEQAEYGRAVMFYPRSLEILDQLGLGNELREIGFITRNAITFRDGKEENARGWTFVQKAIDGNTKVDHCLGVRQFKTEECFRGAIKKINSDIFQAPAKLLEFSVDKNLEYPVLAKINMHERVAYVRSKYLIGADGGHSTVRSMANISFPGTASRFKWARFDAIVKTNMPQSRGISIAIESPTHGNVLWTAIDNGRTRIGYVWPGELEPSAETIMSEAKKALLPFDLEFIKLNWWTVYAIGQRVAERFRDGPILIAGDAAHTHSSGGAQGMNTGIHDASNLGWKLVGVLKGWYAHSILDTYDEERRKAAHQLIQIDKDVASCISGVIPAHINASPDADVNDHLDQVFTVNAAFTVGLGICYEESLINRKDDEAPNLQVVVGHRGPDAAVFRPGAMYPKRLHEFMPNNSRFWILIFAGGIDVEAELPTLEREGRERFIALRTYIESPASFVNKLSPVFEFLTIIRGNGIFQSAETLGAQPLGRVVHDHIGEAYEKYGVDEREGAIVVLRPDGIVAFFHRMDQYGTIGDYFYQFVLPAKKQAQPENLGHVNSEAKRQANGVTLGEISVEGNSIDKKVISKL